MKQSIWKKKPSLEEINKLGENSLASLLDIFYEEITEDSLLASMPISKKTKQPFGLLHGGASAAFAESIGSMGAHFCIDNTMSTAVGMQLQIHHLRGAFKGNLFGRGTPVRLGRSIQVWEIRIYQEKLVALATLTIKVTKK